MCIRDSSYLVFFKGRDVDVMTAAFKEFSAKTVKQKEQPSIRHKLEMCIRDSLTEASPSGISAGYIAVRGDRGKSGFDCGLRKEIGRAHV